MELKDSWKERYWISFARAANAPYRIDCGLEDVDDICNKEKTVPLAWITQDGSDLSQDEDGLPLFVCRRS